MKKPTHSIKPFATAPREVTLGLSCYFRFYNECRLRQNLVYRTPDELYFATGKVKMAA